MAQSSIEVIESTITTHSREGRLPNLMQEPSWFDRLLRKIQDALTPDHEVSKPSSFEMPSADNLLEWFKVGAVVCISFILIWLIVQFVLAKSSKPDFAEMNITRESDGGGSQDPIVLAIQEGDYAKAMRLHWTSFVGSVGLPAHLTILEWESKFSRADREKASYSMFSGREVNRDTFLWFEQKVKEAS